MNCDMNTPYAGNEGMLPQMKGNMYQTISYVKFGSNLFTLSKKIHLVLQLSFNPLPDWYRQIESNLLHFEVKQSFSKLISTIIIVNC